MASGSNLSDELSELNFNSAEDLGKDPTLTHFSRYHVYEDESSQKTIPLIRKHQSVTYDIRRSRLLYETPLSVDMQTKYQLIIDKQQSLVELLKAELVTSSKTIDTLTRDCDQYKVKLSSFVTELWAQLGLSSPVDEIDAAVQRIKQSFSDIKNELALAKLRKDAVEPERKDNGRVKPRLEIDTGTPSNNLNKYKQREDFRYVNYDNGKKALQTTQVPRTSEAQLLKEIETLKEENKKLKSSNANPRPSIPVFVTSPKARQVDIVVEKVIERERIVEKLVYVPQYVQQDKIVEKRVEIKTPVFVDRIKQIPIYKEKIKYKDRIVEKPVEKIVEKIVEKVVEKVIIQEQIVEVERIVYVDRPIYIEKEIQVPVQKKIFIEAQDNSVEPIYIDRDIEIEKIIYLKAGVGRLESRAVQVG